ncbi:unnamed protein product [Parajaminaea phylloscopi]
MPYLRLTSGRDFREDGGVAFPPLRMYPDFRIPQQHTYTGSMAAHEAAPANAMEAQVTAAPSLAHGEGSTGGPTRMARPSSTAPLTTVQLRRRFNTISAADHLYLRLPSGAIKALKPRALDPTSSASASGPGSRKHKVALKGLRASNVAALGKFGSFDLDDLDGVPYGFTWEIGPPKDDCAPQDETMAAADGSAAMVADGGSGKTAVKGKNKAAKGPQPLGTLRIMMGQTLSELEENNATNEDIYDDPQARARMTILDVQALKDSGLEGQDLIDQVLKSSSSFEKRTVFSQEKFIKKKEAKHLRLFTPLPPTLSTIVDYYFENKSADKICGMRIDALSQLLSAGNVAPGGRYIVVDGTNGLLTTACLERMGGEGTLLAIHDAESPPEYEVLKTANLPPSTVEGVLRVLHWGQVDPEYVAPYLPEVPPVLDVADPDVPSRSTPEGNKLWRNRERERHRVQKRHNAAAELEAVRQDLFAGEWDGLLVASPYEPVSIVNTLVPFLDGSAAIAVHSPYLQPLVEAHARLRGNPEIINLSVTEPWMRRYQVLPGRTHPEMSTSATSGYLLSAIRVFTQAQAAGMAEQERERRARSAEATVASAVSEDASKKRSAAELDASNANDASERSAIPDAETVAQPTESEDRHEDKRAKVIADAL